MLLFRSLTILAYFPFSLLYLLFRFPGELFGGMQMSIHIALEFLEV